MSIEHSIARPPAGSFLRSLREANEAFRNAPPEDPWVPTLRRLKGKVGHDGVERLSTTDVFDELEVPLRHRPSRTVRLSRLMRRLGCQTSTRAG
jgi:hypothetical protein